MRSDVCFSLNSNVIQRLKYVRKESVLEILFKSGNIQYYHDVPCDIWNEFKESDYPGKYFYNHFRNKFDFSLEAGEAEAF
ncbi:MAG: KTSC domain-containing protein [Deltaproteobacteria bacterium]|nr:KTSC domain-containing protein [Deltaproteobacteria bacterium]